MKWSRIEQATVATVLSIGATAAFGQTLDTGDTAWVTTASALVLFMTIPGLALFYGGLVRANNVVSVILQCFAITCVVSVVWLVVGYSLAFGDSVWQVIGDLSKAFYAGVGEGVLILSVPESIFATFQLTFAIIAPALIVGAFVERMRFSAVLLFTVAWTLLVYSPIAHWVWGGGWLGQRGFLDYAGGTVVHVTAGTAALVAAMVLGPRQGFPDRTKPPHSTVLALVGAAMLWVGWFGFNGGSALGANGDATMAIASTQVSASAGALVWMFLEWARHGKPTAVGAAIGMIAGLAIVTPGSGFVGPAGALVLGVIGGSVCFAMTGFMKRKLKIDDSLDVFPVHAVGGGLGTLLVGVFASDALGMFSGQHDVNIVDQVRVQALGVAAAAAYYRRNDMGNPEGRRRHRANPRVRRAGNAGVGYDFPRRARLCHVGRRTSQGYGRRGGAQDQFRRQHSGLRRMRSIAFAVLCFAVFGGVATHADYLAYAVGEESKLPLPESLDLIDARYLIDLEWHYRGGQSAVQVLPVDNVSGVASVGATEPASESGEWTERELARVPVDGIRALVSDVSQRTGRFVLVDPDPSSAARGQDLPARSGASRPPAEGRTADFRLQVTVAAYQASAKKPASNPRSLEPRRPAASHGFVAMNFRLVDAATGRVVLAKPRRRFGRAQVERRSRVPVVCRGFRPKYGESPSGNLLWPLSTRVSSRW